ncbi:MULTISPECIES: hypothetical protein [unclassified Luteimonas]
MTKKRNEWANSPVWTIAAGVLLALITFAGVERWQQARAQEAAITAFQRAVADPDPLGWQKAAAQRDRAERTRRSAGEADKALGPGERCIDGQRFRQIDSGFIQMQRPC